MLNIIVFAVGWILFVAAQCKNSLNSKTNSLQGWPGIRTWIVGNSVNLATRAFFSALAFGFLVQTIASKIGAVGFHLTSTTIAGVAGYSANALLYQFFGLFPGLRVEVSDLAPPANAQVVLVPVPSETLPKAPGTS
jgi:hypothetical protein